jgi:hypothetical protein
MMVPFSRSSLMSGILTYSRQIINTAVGVLLLLLTQWQKGLSDVQFVAIGGSPWVADRVAGGGLLCRHRFASDRDVFVFGSRGTCEWLSGRVMRARWWLRHWKLELRDVWEQKVEGRLGESCCGKGKLP